MIGIMYMPYCARLNNISRKVFYKLKGWECKNYIWYENTFTLHNHRLYRDFHKSVLRTCMPNLNDNIELKPADSRPRRIDISNGPGLADFISSSNTLIDPIVTEQIPYVKQIHGNDRKVYFEVYGCQMNVNDTEVVWSILKDNGYKKTDKLMEADIVLIMTCAIRDNAEQKIWYKLKDLKGLQKKRPKKSQMKIGLLGCMAERLKHKLIDESKMVDLVAGPDSYKDLPRLLSVTDSNEAAINVVLSFDETYADIMPVRLNQNNVSAFVSIMRGCDNMCTYCIVPFTRGRERSRPITSILNEIRHLSEEGVKEVTLLGQNVNSYRDTSTSEFYTANKTETTMAKGFKTVYKSKKGGLRFSDLLDKVSLVDPEMRIRFTSPHPKDFPDEVLHLIAERPNICKNLHLPAQSGNSMVLERMRRGYTREIYLELVNHVRSILPYVSISSDFIVGFCGETEQEFEDTLSLVQAVKYNMLYMFQYSMREKTTAHRRFQDDIDANIKRERLIKLSNLFRSEAEKLNKAQVGQRQLILIEKDSRKSDHNFQGRNDGNTIVIIPKVSLPVSEQSDRRKPIELGDYVVVEICCANSQNLKGIPLYHSSISQYSSQADK